MKLNLYMVNMNHCTKYVVKKPFRLKIIIQTHAHIGIHSCEPLFYPATKLIGIAKFCAFFGKLLTTINVETRISTLLRSHFQSW